jgi:DNA-binding CsgD family transcriptional regulator
MMTSAAVLTGFMDTYAHVVMAIGTEAFGPALDNAVASLSKFDLTCVIAYPRSRRPKLLYDGFRGQASKDALDNYFKGTYLLDAVYNASAKNVAPGLYRLHELAPDAFFSSEYFNSAEVHPCISMDRGSLAEELSLLVRPNAELDIAYSIMRSSGSAPFSKAEYSSLQDVAQLLTSAIIRNWQGEHVLGPNDDKRRSDLFAQFASDRLTAREQQIVGAVLKGHSSQSIGNLFDIAEGTVKNHRKSIYGKLNISSQGELFALFVNHVLA